MVSFSSCIQFGSHSVSNLEIRNVSQHICGRFPCEPCHLLRRLCNTMSTEALVRTEMKPRRDDKIWLSSAHQTNSIDTIFNLSRTGPASIATRQLRKFKHSCGETDRMKLQNHHHQTRPRMQQDQQTQQVQARAGALMFPSSCLDGGVTRVGPGRYTQYTRAWYARETVGSSQNNPTTAIN